MGILKNHIPLLTGLDIGLILVRKEPNSEWLGIVASGGFALINENKVTILVNEAEIGSEIALDEAEASLASAKYSLENSEDSKKKLENNSNYKKARVRLL